MKKLIFWLKESDRYKHLIGGFLIALITFNPIYALYSSILAASCLEFKDKQWGGEWDWQDWIITVVGGVLAMVLLIIL